MEIFLDKRAVRQIRAATADAIEEGDVELLLEDILSTFAEHDIESAEQLLGGTDLSELLAEALEEWSGDDVDELFELLETTFADHGIDLKYPTVDDDEPDDEDEVEDYDAYDEPGLDDDL